MGIVLDAVNKLRNARHIKPHSLKGEKEDHNPTNTKLVTVILRVDGEFEALELKKELVQLAGDKKIRLDAGFSRDMDGGQTIIFTITQEESVALATAISARAAHNRANDKTAGLRANFRSGQRKNTSDSNPGPGM